MLRTPVSVIVSAACHLLVAVTFFANTKRVSGEAHAAALPPLVGISVELEPREEKGAAAAAASASAPTSASASASAPASASASAHAAARASASASSAGGPFGAVGDSRAVNVRQTFVRAFVLSAGADPIWAREEIGSSSSGTIEIEIDEEGHLVRSTIVGQPSVALRQGLERARAAFGSRLFVANGAVTRLRVSIVVQDSKGEALTYDWQPLSSDYGTGYFTSADRRVVVRVHR